MQSGGQPWAAAPPAPSPGAVINEVLAWRLVGSLVWHTLAWICGYSAWSLITAWALHAGASPAAVPGLHLAATSTLLLLGALQLLVLLAHHRLLSSSEAPPLYVPALGLHSRGWAGLLISRVLLRTRTWQDLANVALLGVATSATAATSIYLLPRVHHPASSGALDLAFVATYGVCLGVLYTVEHLARCGGRHAAPALGGSIAGAALRAHSRFAGPGPSCQIVVQVPRRGGAPLAAPAQALPAAAAPARM